MLETPKKEIKLNRSLIVCLIIVAVLALIMAGVYLIRNKYSNKISNQTTTEIKNQQDLELKIYNDLNGKKINLESVEFYQPTDTATVRIKSDSKTLTAQSIKNAWIALYGVYRDFDSVSTYNVSVYASDKQLLMIKSIRSTLTGALANSDKSKLDSADPATVNDVLSQLTITSDTGISKLLGQ